MIPASEHEGVRDASAFRPDLYRWNRRKKSKRVHIVGTNSKTLCQIENSRTRLNGRGSQIPDGRKLCGNCKSLQAAGVTVARRNTKKRRWQKWNIFHTSEPRLSVLLGEAVDESPPWDDVPGDNVWRPFPESRLEAREGTVITGGYDATKNPVSALQRPQMGCNGPIKSGQDKTGTVGAG